jgi:hypothetical protein
MAYPDLNPEKFGAGTPLDISNLEMLWKGVNKTNGFLMRSVDGRVPAIQQPIGRIVIDTGNVLVDEGVVPWGNGFWRNIADIDVRPGHCHAQKPQKAVLAGVLKFNQGWQAGHPVAPHGIPDYSRGDMVSKGLVGYKHAMAAVGKESDYLGYIKGVTSKNDPTIRTTWKEWVALYKAGNDGDRLGIFIADDWGFPIVALVAAGVSAPVLAGATFAGFASVFEKEHEAIFFNLDL